MRPDDLLLHRRDVLAGSASALVGGTTLFDTLTGDAAAGPTLDTGTGEIPPLEFFFPNPLLNAQKEPLRDEDIIAVEAEPTAELRDAEAFWTTGEYTAGFEPDGDPPTGDPPTDPVPTDPLEGQETL